MDKKLFIVGAGASSEAELPLGEELKGNIAELLDIKFSYSSQKSGDHKIVLAVNEYCRGHNNGQTFNDYISSAWLIRDHMIYAQSIDNFIDQHNGNKKIEQLGKLAIIRAILQAESTSLMKFHKSNHQAPKLDFTSLKGTWYIQLWRLLTENCRAEDLPDRLSKVAFIIFNYDRCIEHFIFHTLKSYYNLSEDRARELIQLIEIYHPYGQAGSLPWARGQVNIEFGDEPSVEQLLQLSFQIKTFTEGTSEDESHINAIRNTINQAESLIFLGFAYYKQNLELLQPRYAGSGPKMSNKLCIGTSIGISDYDTHQIKNEFPSLFKISGSKTFINNVECNKIFHNYSRALSFVE